MARYETERTPFFCVGHCLIGITGILFRCVGGCVRKQWFRVCIGIKHVITPRSHNLARYRVTPNFIVECSHSAAKLCFSELIMMAIAS